MPILGIYLSVSIRAVHFHLLTAVFGVSPFSFHFDFSQYYRVFGDFDYIMAMDKIGSQPIKSVEIIGSFAALVFTTPQLIL